MKMRPGFKMPLTGGITSIFLTIIFLAPCLCHADCTPPPPGMVSWWRAENDANDSVGSNNGTLSPSGASYANGEVGQGFRFDGANGYVEIPDSATLKPTNVTVEAWVWLDPSHPTNQGSEQIVFKKNTWSAWFEGYSLLKVTLDNGNGTYSDHFQFCISRYGNQVIINSTNTVQRGVWYHVAATYDGNQSKLYVNGVMEASAIAGFALDYDTTPVYIGTTHTWSPYLSMFGGIIDEVSIYNRALSAGEIAVIYNAGSAGKCTGSVTNSSGCTPPPSGLISWWQAEGNADDSVGTNAGVLEGNTTYQAGKVGKAFHFDGTNADVLIPYSTDLQPTNITVECWVKLDTEVTPGANAPGTETIIFKKNSRTIQFEGYTLVKIRSNGRDFFRFAISSASGLQLAADSTTDAQVGVWYHLAGTYDGTNLKLYVNGVLEAATFAGFPLDYGTRPVFFGKTGEWYEGKFGGTLDEPSIYNRALSQSEIQAIYNAGSAGKCTDTVVTNPPTCIEPPSGLVSWWRAENNANDSVGTNNGTPVGNVTYAAGKAGQAFNFDGTGYIPLAASPSLDIGASGSGVTIEGWVKPKSASPLPFVEWDSSSSDGLQLWSDTNLRLFANIKDISGTGHTLAATPGLLSTNSFQHVALTYDKSSGWAILYINGVAVASSNIGTITPQTSYPNYHLNIGRRTGQPIGNGDTFNGLLDEVSLYNRALSQSEIQAIYNAGSAGKCTDTIVTNPPTCTEPPSGLVSWWRAENNANDSVGVNNGILTNGATFATGKVGEAFSFNGVNQFAVVPQSSSLNSFSNQLTIEFWMEANPSNSMTGFQGLFATDHYGVEVSNGLGGTVGVNFYVDTGNGYYMISSGNGGGIPVSSGVWHHVTGVYDGSKLQLYIDGQLAGNPVNASGVVLPMISTSYLSIGSDDGRTYCGCGGRYFWGLIDEPSIYNRALSAGEIAAIYNAGSAGKCTDTIVTSPPTCTEPPSGIVSWWRAENNANDSVWTNNGTPVGNVTYAAGKAGQAFNFDGSSYISMSASSNLDIGVSGDGLTIEGWIKPANNTVNGPIVEWHAQGLQLWCQGGLQLFANLFDTNGVGHTIYTGFGALDTNHFQHVAFIYNKSSGVATLYINGAVVVTNNFGVGLTPQFPVHAPQIGRRWSSGTYLYAGAIDELSLYNRSLSQSEIQAIYNAGSAGKCTDTVVTNPPTCIEPPSGLVSWWRAENNANDSVGTNNGTPVGNVTYAAGKAGQAFNFDGTGYIPLAASPSLDIGASGSGVTIEGWVKPKSASPLPFVEWDSSSSDGLQLWSDTNLRLFANIKDISGTGHTLAATPGLLSTNSFQHMALTYDKSSGWAILYINGVAVASSNIGTITPQTSYPNYHLNIGRRTGQPIGNGDTFNGLLDEISLYNRALSQSEIQAIYNAGSAGKCTDALNHPPVADASATAPLAISVNNSNAPVTLNGSLSYDVDGDALQYLWYKSGFNIATGVVTTVVLPVGTNSITLDVSDGFAIGQDTITVEVITIAQAIVRLKDAVTNNAPDKHNLIAILNAALASIDRSNPTAAINQLKAFQNQVKAQIAPLDPVLAQMLIDEAQNIIDALGGDSPHGAVIQTVTPNGKVHLHFSGTPGASYVIEASSNLKDWVKVGVATDAGGGTFDFDDTPNQASRFYRITTE